MNKTRTMLLAATLALAPLSALADEVAAFYRGKTVTFTSAGGVGGGYGAYAMLLSEHIGKHIPGNPNVIVTYMQGAGGVNAANHTYNVAPKDGTVVLAPLQSMPTLQLLGRSGIRYDAAKFQWIGRAAETTSGFVVRRTVAASADALKAREAETNVGITQIGGPNHILPALMKYCTGAKLKLVSGYNGSGPIALAFQRGEVDGLGLPLDSLRLFYAEVLKDAMIAQTGFERAAAFPDVPLVLDLCPDPEKKKVVEVFQVQEVMGRAYAVAPGVPAARVTALRRAFDAAIRDPALFASAKERKLDINPLAGEAVQKIVERHIATSSETVAAAKQAVGMK